MYFPVNGTYAGRVFTRSILKATPSSWRLLSIFDGSYTSLTNTPTIPTKTSELTNDSGFLTSVPSEYVTETELDSKGYLTEHQDISGKADKATTLSGYGIGDAYTKTEVDAAISSAITTTLNTEV